MEKKISITTSEKAGYSPVWDYESWRVAMTLDTPEMHRDRITTIAKHLETDEAFILLEGNANLYIGDGGDEVGKLTKYQMEPGKLYVVHPSTWHVTETLAGCRILIVENRNTGDANTIKIPFDGNQLF